MSDTVAMTFCLAGLLLAVATPSFGQVTPRTAPAFVQPMPRLLLVEEAAPDARTIAADTTLRFYDLSNGAFDQSLGADDLFFVRAFGLFFTAPFDGTLDRVDFELSSFCPDLPEPCSPGVAGTGTLRIKLIEATEVPLNPPFSPGVDSLDIDFSGDSLDVNFPNLMAHGLIRPMNFINQIDVSGLNFEIQDSVDYFIQLTLIDESDDAALTFIFDGGSDDSTDTTFVHLNVLFELQLSKDVPPPPPPPGSARMQLVHNAPGTEAVDLYVGDSLVVDDLSFREATSFLDVTAGLQTIDLVAAGDSSNSNPLVSITDSLAENQFYWTMAFGTLGQNLDVAIAPVRSDTSGGDQTPLIVVHGGLGADSVTVRILDETHEHNAVDTLAQDLGFGQFAASAALTPGFFNIEVATNGTSIDVYRVEIPDLAASDSTALLLLTSGILGGDPAFGLLTVDPEGNVAVPSVNTATEPRVVPERFVLHANYPNPFNPTTTIRFDLDAPGFTRLRIYNLLGQAVATLVAEPLPVGSYEMVFDASGLPSGSYVYRLTSGRFSQQRMLMLIK